MVVNPESKVYYSIQEICKRFSKETRGDSKLVFVNGTFDLFHVGHSTLLNGAAELGNELLVFINTDESIRTLKGPKRPVLPMKERMYLLASLECVDAVFAFPETRVTPYLEIIKPDIWAKASDYTLESINPEEKIVADLMGIDIRILPKVEGISSTDLIKRIKDSM